jgi:hypothetical protein
MLRRGDPAPVRLRLCPISKGLDELIEEDRKVVAQLGGREIDVIGLAGDATKPALHDLRSLRPQEFG